MHQELLDEICVNEEGRHEVNLTFKISHPVIPDNFEQRKKHFSDKMQSIEK